MKTFFLLLFWAVIPLLGFTQTTTFGTASNEDGDLLIGAVIVVENEGFGVTTDLDGKYQIENNGKDLKIVYVGHKTIIVKAPGGELNIILSADSSPLEGSIVILDQRIRSVHNYNRIKANLLNLQRQSDLAPILNTSPGLLMHSGALNTNRITIRGIGNRSPFSTNKIKAYLDDIPLTSGSGETTIEDIDLSFINSIEVWKGPTSSKYGAGLGGMILMNSINTIDQISFISTKNTLGSYGLQRHATDVHLNKKEEQFSVHLNHNLTKNDGYRDNNDYRRQGFTLLAKKGLKDSEFNVFLNHTSLKAFIPSSLNETDFQDEPTKAAFTWGRIKGFEEYDKLLVGISYATQFNYYTRLRTAFFINNRNSYESRPFNILTENSNAIGLRSVLSVLPNNFLWNPEFRLGTEVFKENYDWQTFVTNAGQLGNPLSINSEVRSYANIFGEIIFRFGNTEQWKVTSGLNFNATNYDLEDRFFADSIDRSGDYSFDPVLSPRLALSFSPKENNDYYALVSHGFSPPSLEETLAPDGSINREIQPEKAWNIEIGTRYVSNFKRWRYEFSLFTMHVNDLLVARRTDFDQYIGINAGKTTHNGLEAQLSYDLIKKNRKRLGLLVNYTYSDFKFSEFIDDEDDFSGNKLTGTAPHILNTILSGEYLGIYSSLNYHFVDAMPLTDANTIYSEAYQLLHFKLGYRFKLDRHWHFDISAGINNVLDEKYAAMHQINASSFGGNAPRYYYPGLPRNYYIGLDLRYTFKPQ